MNLGAYIFPTAYTISMVELARAMEERGFESLFVPEHTHIPSARRSPWPGGGELPREYSNTLDPFVGLAAAAAVTRTLRIGTGICLLTERDPLRFEAGQACKNCALYSDTDDAQWGGCSIFPGKLVNADGWCNVYAPMS